MWAHTGGEARKCAFILERWTQVSPALLVKCPGFEITAGGSHQPRVSCSLWIHLKYLLCTNSMWGYLDKTKLPQICSGELRPPAPAADGKAQPQRLCPQSVGGVGHRGCLVSKYTSGYLCQSHQLPSGPRRDWTIHGMSYIFKTPNCLQALGKTMQRTKFPWFFKQFLCNN